ncbi:MAG: phosphocholine cytidylyltransferase family protein [Cyclobacteriaceae bacterium]|nr:phosphocholine cytidylyltransferase family protein [Cyclobacteriaceae bacterium]
MTKAVILAAGVGSRIRPLTDNCPKSLLEIGETTIMERMLTNIQACGINEVVIVLGYLKEQIKTFVKENFPHLTVHFITNTLYESTNTGYSLMLTKKIIGNSDFIKFDADVVFDIAILANLLKSDLPNCLCIDKNIQLDAEEIKVIVNKDNRIIKASKTVLPKDAIGESIGIEKISSSTATLLFETLIQMMKDPNNHQDYYEAAYENLMDKDVPFHALDITGLSWTEIDTLEDFATAEKIFVSDRV